MRTGVILAAVLTIGGIATAGDAPPPTPPATMPVVPAAKPAPPLTLEQAVDAVLAAIKAKDDAALKALAATDAPDPWLVADELIARRELGAAGAFASAAPRKAVERLPAYVALRGDEPDDAAARASLASANAALAAGKAKDALEVLGPAGVAPPRDVVGIRRVFGRGLALSAVGKLEESVAAFLGAADAAERVGWIARALKSLHQAGIAAGRRSDYASALSAFERQRVVATDLDDEAGLASILCNIGLVHQSFGKYANALKCYEGAFVIRDNLGDVAGVADTLCSIGTAHHSLGNYTTALEYDERALKMLESAGDRAGMADALINICNVNCSLGNYRKALEYGERALKIKETLGDEGGLADILGNIGIVYQRLANYPKALEYYDRSLAEDAGNRAGEAPTLSNIGIVYSSLGDYPKALEYYERALKIEEELGNRPSVGAILNNIGVVYERLANYGKALEYYKRALGEDGDQLAAAATLGIGNVQSLLSNYPKALAHYELALAIFEKLSDRQAMADTLGNIAVVHDALGNYPKGLEYHERALKLKEDMGDRAGMAGTLTNIGGVQYALRQYTKALEYHERALRVMEEIGDRANVAAILVNIGTAHGALGHYPEALQVCERALQKAEAAGRPQWAASALAAIGNVYLSLGDHPKALEYQERALKRMEDVGNRAGMAYTLGRIGLVHLALHDYSKAIAFERRASDLVSGLARGLSAEESALAREPSSFMFEVGAGAAVATKDASELAFFLESGRAVALLEELNARETLSSVAVPEGLRIAEASARAVQGSATKALRRAIDEGDLSAVRARKADLDAANDGVSTLIARIQRDAKAGAALVYPAVASLETIRATLGDGDVLVLFALSRTPRSREASTDLANDLAALVVTKADARIVALGSKEAVEEVVGALALHDVRTDPTVALATLKALVVAPLALPATTKRVLVGPAGALCYAPFAALFPGLIVAYVPSGTTYATLLQEGAKRGDGVLALGDPDYETKFDKQAVAVNRGVAGPLLPLPGTREEANAVGTVVLLRGDATEAEFALTLATRRRWRAVHLACHGLVNIERPSVSSLAITAAGDDDGFLTCLDVFRMSVPADLVVLSACETGRGQVVKTEGIVGLTRAFMFAGSPRVICSLWKVDDEATRALMVKFYELWNPKDTSKAMPTAAALKAAQEYVRTREVEVVDTAASQREGRTVTKRTRPWEHPYYWAAWVLWGLPS